MCHDAGLPKAATAVRGIVACQILLKDIPRGSVARHGLRGVLRCGHAFGIVAQVFGQVTHTRLQPVVQGVGLDIGRVAQRPYVKPQSRFF